MPTSTDILLLLINSIPNEDKKKKKTQCFSEELILNLQFHIESTNKDSQTLNNSMWL